MYDQAVCTQGLNHYFSLPYGLGPKDIRSWPHPARVEKGALIGEGDAIKNISNITDKFQGQGMMQKEKQRSTVGEENRVNLSQTTSISNL